MEVEVCEQDVFIPFLWTDWVYLDLWKTCSWSLKSILPEMEKCHWHGHNSRNKQKGYSTFLIHGLWRFIWPCFWECLWKCWSIPEWSRPACCRCICPMKKTGYSVSSGKRLSLGFAFLSTYFIHLLYCHIILVANIGYTEWSSSSYTK